MMLVDELGAINSMIVLRKSHILITYVNSM